LISYYDPRRLAGDLASCESSLSRDQVIMQSRSKARTARRLSKDQYEMLAAFRYQLRQFLHFSELAAQHAGLTPRQHQALLAIKGFPNRETITIGELAEQLHIAHHSAVGLVDRSVEQDLIAREQGVKDRRQVYIKLTDHGAQVLEQLSGAHRNEIRRLGPSLRLLLNSLMGDQNDKARRQQLQWASE
jgi:DNA-binding MarR family transcriptional regulator